MYCNKCGIEVSSSASFCSSCGENLNREICKPTKPETNLILAILCTVLCCAPFGIVSIVYSISVNNKYDLGLYVEAEEAARKSVRWSMYGLIAGLISGFLYLILMILTELL